jgi:hypothetical protein
MGRRERRTGIDEDRIEAAEILQRIEIRDLDRINGEACPDAGVDVGSRRVEPERIGLARAQERVGKLRIEIRGSVGESFGAAGGDLGEDERGRIDAVVDEIREIEDLGEQRIVAAQVRAEAEFRERVAIMPDQRCEPSRQRRDFEETRARLRALGPVLPRQGAYRVEKARLRHARDIGIAEPERARQV